MRLLQRKADGYLALREFTDKNVPTYAIVSHTWATDNSEEVSFKDVETDAGKSKAGWKKIDFCARQAATDGLQYFWIDTCCINKSNALELSAAINSMFRWYQRAARCYVYLSDVLTRGEEQDGLINPAWEPAFRKSRWFTRGWTLQELIAPKLVDFFSLDEERLGNKSSLEIMIHEITGIARKALQGDPLPNFSIDERMRWAECRKTTMKEDGAYCLLGIFGVAMPLLYGEGEEKAYRRLLEEIHKSHESADFDQFIVGLNISAIPEATDFVGREEELVQMHQLLHGHKSRSIVVLHGLGGIGKTQLATEYARRHKEKYTAMFWLNANDEDFLKLSFRNIAQQVLEHHPSTNTLASVELDNLDQVVNAVQTWLNLPMNTQWLMIYDNYDNPRTPGNPDQSAVDIRQFIPRSDHGSIIITTRSSQVSLGKRIHVRKLPNIEEGIAILSNTSGRKDVKDDPDAVRLVKELDGLPLALSTAGAYLEHVTTSFSDYLRLYRTSWLKLQQTSPQLIAYEDRSLYSTWQITFDRIQQQNAGSAKLLKLWAYFDRQDVWFELLRHGSSPNEKWLQELTEDELSFNKAIRLLRDYGLVDADLSFQELSGSGGYSVQSCVHSWTTFVLNREWDKSLARLALVCVASEIPIMDVDRWWLLQRRVLQHAARYEYLIVNGKVDVEGMEWALHRLGDLYTDQGKLAEAEAMYNRALEGREEALGPKHTSTLSTVNNLGILYKSQGKLAEAEAMYNRALQGYEKALGPKQTSTLSTVNNLGVLYKSQGKLAKAEAMYNQALQGYEETLGLKHISTLSTVNNLGALYKSQGKLAEAEAMYIRALQGREEALGLKHTSTLDTVNNLGNLYASQGKLAKAESMYKRALQGKEEALGPKHTSTLDMVNNLSLLYASQGKLAEAEKMYIRVLQGKEEALGLDHTSTLLTVSNLGNLYTDQGKLAEAEKMYIRALQGCEEALGSDHTSTLLTVNNLGILYKNQGKLAEAEAMYNRALQGYEEALGLKHISTLSTVNNLGILYQSQGKLAEAEAMYIRALQGKEEALGPKHTSTLDTVNNLGNLYASQGKLAKAESMYKRALQGKEEALGPKHTSTLDTVNKLGLLYADQGKLDKAEEMYKQALQGYEDALGPELLSSYLPALSIMFAFGDLFSQTGRKDLAKIMYSRALPGYTAVQGPSSKWSKILEDRLRLLQVASVKSKASEEEEEVTETGAQVARPLKRNRTALAEYHVINKVSRQRWLGARVSLP